MISRYKIIDYKKIHIVSYNNLIKRNKNKIRKTLIFKYNEKT